MSSVYAWYILIIFLQIAIPIGRYREKESQMNKWYEESVFYHIYPLGLCGAPEKNNYSSKIEYKLGQLYDWIPHLVDLGINAIYLGPLFMSESHGYDTVDYYKVDSRLGDNRLLKELVESFHNNGIKVVLDGVFNHVSRDFFAFKDVIKNKENSQYVSWFNEIDFKRSSPLGDDFSYNGWRGHYNLVQLNLKNRDVIDYLFNAVKMWIKDFHIDGLRLDVADVLDFNFMKELSKFTKEIDSDFWLMGEVIHGDYSSWIEEARLDSTTNYECYKGMYSSFNDKNMFEIAYSLNRLFNSNNGMYKGMKLYNFVDNHDVNRVASVLDNYSHLFPLHILLFTIPGIPSIYYGSEWGLKGVKTQVSDCNLRPVINIADNIYRKDKSLVSTIKKLANIWRCSKALMNGTYIELYKDNEQLVFKREYKDEVYIVLINSSNMDVTLNLKLDHNFFVDLLNEGDSFTFVKEVSLIKLNASWGRILKAVN